MDGITRHIHHAVRHVRAFDVRRPWLWNALLPLLIALPGLDVLIDGTWRDGPADVRPGPPPDGIPPSWPWLLSAGLVLPLLWRRRWPFPVFLVISGFLLVTGQLGLGLPVSLSVVVALYGVALRGPLSRLGWACASIVVTMAAEALSLRPPQDLAHSYVPVLAITAAVVAAGIAVRTRREHVASLLERAERLEVERDQRARLAAAAERARIAREMHDILAHNLSVITGLADGGSYAARGSPERARQALDAIATTSRQALDDLRGLLGVLKDTHSALAPQPGLPDLEPLLERVRAAGLPVRALHEGTGADAAGDQSPGRQLTVYRVVQEALTNTLKHGGDAATATVTVTHAHDGTDVTVTDTGSGTGTGSSSGTGTGTGPDAGPGPAADGGGPDPDPGQGSGGRNPDRNPVGGQGIGGMRDRARAYGGTLEAGPVTGGGWRVHLWLPAQPTTAQGRVRGRATGRTRGQAQGRATGGAGDDSSDRGRPADAALRLPDAAGEPGRPDAPG